MTPDEARRIVAALDGVIGPDEGQVSDWRAIRLLQGACRLLEEAELEAGPVGAALAPPAGSKWHVEDRRQAPPSEEHTPSAAATRLVVLAEEMAGRPCRDPGQMEALIDAVLSAARARNGAEAPSRLLPRLRTALNAARLELVATADNDAALARIAGAIDARAAAEQHRATDGKVAIPSDAVLPAWASAPVLVDNLVHDIARMIDVLDHMPKGEPGRPPSVEEQAIGALALGWRDQLGEVPGQPNRWEGAAPDAFVVWAEAVAEASGGAFARKAFADIWTRALRRGLGPKERGVG
jgi:hypothetical protein